MRRLVLVALMTSCLALCTSSDSPAQTATLSPGVLKSEFIYETAPFPSCHASTMAETTSGTLVAAWFGGEYEKHPAVGVWLSRHIEGRWTAVCQSDAWGYKSDAWGSKSDA